MSHFPVPPDSACSHQVAPVHGSAASYVFHTPPHKYTGPKPPGQVPIPAPTKPKD